MSTHATPFEELYATHYLRIYWHVYRLVRQHEEAEDLTQTAFLKAWRAWPPGSDTNLPGWLSTIATRVALDALAHARCLSFQSLDPGVLAVCFVCPSVGIVELLVWKIAVPIEDVRHH